MSEQYAPIRRFVTGHDANNAAKVIMEGPATNAKHPGPGTVSTLVWSTDRTPADISIGEDVEDLGARHPVGDRTSRHRSGQRALRSILEILSLVTRGLDPRIYQENVLHQLRGIGVGADCETACTWTSFAPELSMHQPRLCVHS